jgi:hypothetical protein
MAKPAGMLNWDLEGIAESLRLSPMDAKSYFTDGRRVSFILERRIAYEVLGGKLAPSEGAGFDIIDKNGGKWEVRSITRSGIYFCPSYMVGSGRSFNEAGFLTKLGEIEGYIVSDIELFPNIPYWQISKTVVSNWYKNSSLGSGTKVSRDRILNLIDRI